MAKPLSFLDRANETTITTGTGTVTLSGIAVSSYQTWSSAGAVDNTQYSYLIIDNSNSEWGIGTYTASGTTFSRDTVTGSIIGGVSGTSKINLSGSAQVAQVERAGDVASLVRLGETVTTGSASSVIFSSIPGYYRHLRIIVSGRSQISGQDNDTVLIQLNGDTGANYNWSRIGSAWFGSGATFNSGVLAATAATVGFVSGATANANGSGLTITDIGDYVGTTFWKTGNSTFTATGNGSIFEGSLGWTWKNTASITSVKVFLGTGPFVDDSVVSLHGVR